MVSSRWVSTIGLLGVGSWPILIALYSLAGLVNCLTWNTCFVRHTFPASDSIPASVSICVTRFWGLYLDVIIKMIYRGFVSVGVFWGTWLQSLPLTLIVFPSDLEAKHNLHVFLFFFLMESLALWSYLPSLGPGGIILNPPPKSQ